MDLISEEARIYMLLWDNILRTKCKDLGLKVDLYRRYVDDMLLVLRAVGKVWSYNKNKGILKYSH